MFPGGFDLGNLQKYVKDFQKKMKTIQNDLRERIVEASTGGGMVKVKMNGLEEVVDIKIEPEVINVDDKDMLEDLILACVNEAVRKAKELKEREFFKVAGGGLPGLADFFFEK
jgi:hypothetical protein